MADRDWIDIGAAADLSRTPLKRVSFDAAGKPRRFPWLDRADSWDDGGVHGAPGPNADAGLPVLAIGYGVYWLDGLRGPVEEGATFASLRIWTTLSVHHVNS
jgi:hypothetical protein